MTSHKGVDDRYWSRRSDMMYYKYIDILVRAFAYNAKSVIDIGSANTRYLESFYWIPQKFTLDIKNPYRSTNVIAIETDFLNYNPEEKFDFAICLQVLEHIPDVENFAKKLFDVSDKVLISVPYLWPEDAEKEHINDPVDREKLKQWTGRDPSYSIIVAEPLRIPSKGISRRLICYYGPEGEKIDYKKANMNVAEFKKSNGSEEELEKLFTQVEESKKSQKIIQKTLNDIAIDQKKYYQLVKLELENFNYENNLKDKALENQNIENKINSYNKEIKRYKTLIHRESKQQQRYLKEHKKILESKSWRIMAPMRMVGAFVKKIFRKIKVQSRRV